MAKKLVEIGRSMGAPVVAKRGMVPQIGAFGVVGLALVAQCHHGGLADVGLHRSEQGGLVFG